MSSNIELCKKLLSKIKSPQKREKEDDSSRFKKIKKLTSRDRYVNERNQPDNYEDDTIKNGEDSIVIGTAPEGNIAFKVKKDPNTGELYLSNTRLLVVGQSGSGKSFLSRVIVERFAESNIANFLVFDPGGDWANIRSEFDFIIFGGKGKCDIEISKENAAEISKKVIDNNVSAVIDLSLFPEDDKANILALFIDQILLIYADPSIAKRRPLVVLIDEAQLFCKKSIKSDANSASRDCLIRLANTGRRFGISSVYITQRVSLLPPNIVGACNNYLLGRAMQSVDLKKYCEITGIKQKEAHKFKNLIHQFYALGESFDHSHLGRAIKFRSLKNITVHPEEGFLHLTKMPDPLFETVQKIKLFDKNYKVKSINSIVSKDDFSSSRQPELPKSNYNTTKKLTEIKSEPLSSKFEPIIQSFKKISLKDLYILSLQKNYNEISALFEINLLIKETADKFTGPIYQYSEGTVYYIAEPKPGEPIKQPLLLKSHEYIELWKTELNDYMLDKLIDYLFQDENCNNEYHHIEKFTGLTKIEIAELFNKYQSLNLLSRDSECIYLNPIFFSSNIHCADQQIQPDKEFEEFIDNELNKKPKELQQNNKNSDDDIFEDDDDDYDDGEFMDDDD